MKILYIDHYAGSPTLGMEFRPFYMAREWAKLGHEVTIVGSSYSHYRAKQVELEKAWTIERLENVSFIWLRTKPYDGNGLGRIRNIFEFLISLNSIEKKLPNERFDVVIASSTYPYDNFCAARFAKKWDATHIFEVHDLWPLSPIELGGYKKYHPFVILTQHAEDFAYKHADAVVSILPKAEPYMVDRGLASSKFHAIPNGVNREEIDGETIPLFESYTRVIKEFSQGRFLVGYAGAHGLANALDSFLAAAMELPDFGFVLIGDGTEKANLMRSFGGLQNVLFLDPIPRKMIPNFFAMMDVLYIGLKKQPLFRFGVSPNKLMDYMLAKKPIVCAIEAGNDIVSESGCGITIASEDVSAVVKALREMKSMTVQTRFAMGERGREYVIKNHDNEQLARTMLKILIESYKTKTHTIERKI